MRDTVPEWVLSDSHTARTTISAWRGGELLAEDVPIDSGAMSGDASSSVPWRTTLRTTPDLMPRAVTDPLSVYGQRLSIQQTISAGGQSWTVNLGWALVQAVSARDTGVDVEALSLDQLILDYRFESPYVRAPSAMYSGVLRDLARGVLPVSVVGLTDRAVGSTLTQNWDEDRMSALRGLATNWPADIRVDDTGVLLATPEREVGDPVRAWVHGEASAYVTIGTDAIRDEIYNAVVARGEDANGNPVQATAVDNVTSSPTYYYGPFGRRPRFYESPLITTKTQALASAASVLRRELRRTRQITVQAPPDPRLELLDTVAVTDDTGTITVGLLTGIDLPLTAQDGAATYTVSRET